MLRGDPVSPSAKKHFDDVLAKMSTGVDLSGITKGAELSKCVDFSGITKAARAQTDFAIQIAERFRSEEAWGAEQESNA